MYRFLGAVEAVFGSVRPLQPPAQEDIDRPGVLFLAAIAEGPKGQVQQAISIEITAPRDGDAQLISLADPMEVGIGLLQVAALGNGPQEEGGASAAMLWGALAPGADKEVPIAIAIEISRAREADARGITGP